jgi:carnitine monooxygenase subunit
MASEKEHIFIVYPDADPKGTAAKAPYIDYGTARLDVTGHHSREAMEAEWRSFWTKTWWFAGLAHDLPEIGDYFSVDMGRESFVVARHGKCAEDVHAFYNVCPHRGNQLVQNEFGHVNGGCFQCDFHGWQFRLDGSNAKIRDETIFRPEAIAHRPGLTPVRCEVWNSLVFLNMDPNAGPLLEHLDVIPEHLNAYPFEKYRVIRDIEVVWDANWKTALDAFVEFYHADDVHPQVLPFSETLACQYDLYDKGVSRMIIPLGYAPVGLPDRDSVSDMLKMFLQFFGGNPDDYKHLKGYEYKSAVMATKRKWAKINGYAFFDNLTDDQVVDDWNYHIFPNVTLNVFSDSLLIQVFRPHRTDPAKSHYEAISLCLPVPNTPFHVMDPGSFGPEAVSPPGWDGLVRPPRVKPEKLEDFGSVLSQDARRVPAVQKGVSSAAFKGYVLSESEIRIRHYLAELERYLKDGSKAAKGSGARN